MPRLRSRRLRGILIALGAALALFVLYRVSLMRQVARTEQRLSVEGLLLSAEDLNDAYPRIPDDQNAALAYEEAATLLKAFRYIDADWAGDGGDFVPHHATHFTDEQLERVAEFLAENEAALTLCRRAQTIDAARYELPSDPDAWVFVRAPRVSMSAGQFDQMETLGVLLAIAARYEFATSDAASGVDYLEDAFALARSLFDCPNSHAQIHGLTIMQSIASIGFDVVTSPGPDEDRLVHLMREVAVYEEETAFRTAIAYGLTEAYRKAEDVRLNPSSYSDDTEFLDQLLYVQLPVLGSSIHFLKRALGADDQGRRRDLGALESFYAILTEPPDWPWIAEKHPECEECFSEFARRSSVVSLVEWRFLAAVNVRSKRVALAVEHFRRDERRTPYELEELVPRYLDSIPLDPYDSKPLRMVQRMDEYTIYSVGPDRTDDLGILRYNRSSHRDIGFSVQVADN